MATMKQMYGMQQQNIVVPAYTMRSVFFDTIHPNYFRLHNQGSGTLFCGTSHQPTQQQYDFSVGAEKMQVYAEPTERSVLFIYNPTGSDIPATLLTFKADFDPLALVLSNLSIDLSGSSIETSGNISSFSTSLPAGSNKLGSVDIANTSALGTIMGQNGNPYYSSVAVYEQSEISTTTTINSSGKCVIHFLTNDGSVDMTLTLGGQSLTLKAGESIQNLKFDGAISVSGSGYSFRALVTKG